MTRGSGREPRVVYLDANATTPLDPEVLNVIAEGARFWANPSSSYGAGREAKQVVREARLDVARMVSADCPEEEIVFTSGGTETNNWLIFSCIKEFLRISKDSTTAGVSGARSLPHFVTSNIEHDSVKLPLEELSSGSSPSLEVTFVPVSKITGAVEPEAVIEAIRRNTILVTVMLANNETGLIQPIRQLGQQLIVVNNERRKEGLPSVLLHSDAAQAFGKLDVDVNDLRVDYLTIVGHKFYGPRIGALYKKREAPLHPLFFGGGQEKGLRPGTENTLLITGLGKAAQLVSQNIQKYANHMKGLQNDLEDQLISAFGETITINGRDTHKFGRLPNTVSVSFKKSPLKGHLILKFATSIRASVGAACHSAVDEEGDSGDKPSAVLIASGVSPDLASSTLRLSVGRETTKTDIDFAVDDLKRAVALILTG